MSGFIYSHILYFPSAPILKRWRKITISSNRIDICIDKGLLTSLSSSGTIYAVGRSKY